MKTVEYNGLVVTGDDNKIDELLYTLEHKNVKAIDDGVSFSDLVNTVLKLNRLFVPENFETLPANLFIEDRTQWTKQFILCMQDELSELLGQIPWKHWKNYDNFELDLNALKFEIADLFIFLIGIAGIWGMNGREILEYIANKMDVNFTRQERGY